MQTDTRRMETQADSPLDAGFDALACMPEQVLPWSGLAANLQPERRLMLAVLEDAVTCYFRCAFSTTGAARQEFTEAADWIGADDLSWPFSFVNICAALEIDPDYVRRGLARWRARESEVPASARRRIGAPFRRMNGTRTRTCADAPGLRLAG